MDKIDKLIDIVKDLTGTVANMYKSQSRKENEFVALKKANSGIEKVRDALEELDNSRGLGTCNRCDKSCALGSLQSYDGTARKCCQECFASLKTHQQNN